VKALNITEFYSERGGGVRSHLTSKSHVSCQLGHEHVVIAPGPRDSEESYAVDGTASPRARIIRIAGPSLPYDPTYHLLWRVDKVREVVARERPDVLEIDSPYVAAICALSVPRADFGVRTFVWHADFIDTYVRTALEPRLGTAAARTLVEPLWMMVRGIASRCDATFVASRWMVDKLEAHGVARVRHLPFGIERERFTPAARNESVRRRILGPGRDDWALLVGVGRFAIEKRWDVVLDAFARLRKERRAVLVLYGDGPERRAMEARVAGRDDVHLPGFEQDRTKLASALAGADALVHGCPFETFGFAVAEAMSAGLPVVVPAEGGAAELADDGSAERYVAGDSEACARAVLRLLGRAEQDREAMRRSAVRAAERIPTVREQFEHTYAAYADLLARRHHETGHGERGEPSSPKSAGT
jgi:alpha-1,6-mannosyltransferase